MLSTIFLVVFHIVHQLIEYVLDNKNIWSCRRPVHCAHGALKIAGDDKNDRHKIAKSTALHIEARAVRL